jgi:hypothetical protein
VYQLGYIELLENIIGIKVCVPGKALSQNICVELYEIVVKFQKQVHADDSPLHDHHSTRGISVEQYFMDNPYVFQNVKHIQLRGCFVTSSKPLITALNMAKKLHTLCINAEGLTADLLSQLSSDVDKQSTLKRFALHSEPKSVPAFNGVSLSAILPLTKLEDVFIHRGVLVPMNDLKALFVGLPALDIIQCRVGIPFDNMYFVTVEQVVTSLNTQRRENQLKPVTHTYIDTYEFL